MNLTENALALTRLIGKKELEFGCLIVIRSNVFTPHQRVYVVVGAYQETVRFTFPGIKSKTFTKDIEIVKEIIGNPVTIDDVHRWAEGAGFSMEIQKYSEHFIALSGYKRIPFLANLPLHHPDNDQACKELVDFISNYKG